LCQTRMLWPNITSNCVAIWWTIVEKWMLLLRTQSMNAWRCTTFLWTCWVPPRGTRSSATRVQSLAGCLSLVAIMLHWRIATTAVVHFYSSTQGFGESSTGHIDGDANPPLLIIATEHRRRYKCCSTIWKGVCCNA
jgi:hypothetical protein